MSRKEALTPSLNKLKSKQKPLKKVLKVLMKLEANFKKRHV
jgi:hypothetical protein